MTLTVDIPLELEQYLCQEAARQGVITGSDDATACGKVFRAATTS